MEEKTVEEKIIIKSEHYNIKKFVKIIFAVSGILVAVGLVFYLLDVDGCRYSTYWNETWSILDNMSDPFSFIPGLLIDTAILMSIVAPVINWWLGSYRLTITDKRIYGNSSFGKRVDLPIDSVSAVGTSAFKGIAITTTSGAIKFALIKNRDEIHSAVSKLLMERQGKPTATTTIKQEIPQSNAEELRKYKELLDMGVISQEEFDAKKKQLLGL